MKQIQIANSPHLDAKMSDICYGTAAAPTYFPPYYFENDDGKGNQHEFNLIDGGVVAVNPVHSLINHLNSESFFVR